MVTEHKCRCTHYSHQGEHCEHMMDAEDMLCTDCRRCLAIEARNKREALKMSAEFENAGLPRRG